MSSLGGSIVGQTMPMALGGNPQAPGMGLASGAGGNPQQPSAGLTQAPGAGLGVPQSPVEGMGPIGSGAGGNPQMPQNPSMGPLGGNPQTQGPGTAPGSSGGFGTGATGPASSWQTAPGQNTGFGTPGYQYGLQADQGNINSHLGLDTSKIGWGGAPVSSVGPSQRYLGQSIDAMYGQQTSRLDPQFAHQREQLDSQLANQGLTPGSEAWKQAKQQQQFGQNDAYSQVRNNSIMFGGQEAQRMQGMDLAGGNFANQAAQQNFNNQGTSQDRQNAAMMGEGNFDNAAQQQRFNQLMGQAQLNNQAYGQNLGYATQKDISNNQIASNNAANTAAQNERNREFDFNAARQMRFDPLYEQNLMMEGMGPPQNPGYGNTNVPNLPGYQSETGQQQQYQQNQAAGNSSLLSMGGNLLSRFLGY